MIWKGYYRFPTELEFSADDEYNQAFVVSGANIFAKMLQVKPSTNADIAKTLESLPQSIDFKCKKC